MKVIIWKLARIGFDTIDLEFAGNTFDDWEDLKKYYVEEDTVIKVTSK